MTAVVGVAALPVPRHARGTADVSGHLVTACVLFNGALCFANTRVLDVSGVHVVASELALIGAALALSTRQMSPEKRFWLLVLLVQMTWLAFLSVARLEVLAKPLRDVMIMPVFVMLGLSARNVRLTDMLLALTALIATVALFEALWMDRFLSLFNVREYFIAKGAENDFTFSQTDLFVSGIRPEGRFLLDAGFHRVSSLFLEPVSLGFYGFIVGAYAVAARDAMSGWRAALLLFMAFFVIWISDGRMAFGALVLTVLCRGWLAALDHRLGTFVFPVILLCAAVVYAGALLSVGGEGIGARVFSTMELFRTSDGVTLLGLSGYAGSTADSALLDLIAHQGVFGFAVYWLSPFLFDGRPSPAVRIYTFAVALFVSGGFLFSAAIFTIKTAALLWFVYGHLVAVAPAGPAVRR